MVTDETLEAVAMQRVVREETQRTTLNTRRRMRVGVNYPWISFGADFGAPVPWAPSAQWRSRIDNELEEFRRLGIFAVRWWLLCSGANYGIYGDAPHPDPARRYRGMLYNSRTHRDEVYDGPQWRFIPAALHEQFLRDFETLLNSFRNHGIKLIPTLMGGYSWLLPGEVMAPGFVKGGRADVVIDPGKSQNFFNRVLDPTLQVAARFRDTIYAFELLNEPEFWTTIEAPSWRNPLREWIPPIARIVPEARLREFIQEGVRRVNRANLPSTIAFGLDDALSRWGPGIAIPQVHYYPSPEQRLRSPSGGLIVGEFANNARHNQPWPELAPNEQDVYHRLRHIESLGYEVAFMWSADGTRNASHSIDGATDWSDAVKRQVQRYTSGH